MRGLRLGLGGGNVRTSIRLTNLSTDSLGSYAENGNAIGFTVSRGLASSQKWQSSADATTPSDIVGATSATFTPTIGTNVTDAHFIRAAVTVDGVEYFSPWRQVRRAPGAIPPLFGVTWTVDVTVVNIAAALVGDTSSASYAFTGLPAGVSGNTGTGAITGTPTAVSSGPVGIVATDSYGRVFSYGFTQASSLLAPGDFPAMTDQSFTDGTGNQTYQHAAATGANLTFTYAATGLIPGVTYNAGTRTFTFDTNALDVQADTTFTATATDQYGRPASGSPRSAQFDIVTAPPAITMTVDADATLVLNADGTVTITIASPEPYSLYDEGDGLGVYIRDLDAPTGPIVLYPGEVIGAAEVDQFLSVSHPPLAIYTAATLPAFAWQWQRDTANNGVFADITGATSETYLVAEESAGNTVRVSWSLTDDNGTTTGTLGAFVIPPPATWATEGDDGTITITSQPAIPQAPATTGGDGTITITG